VARLFLQEVYLLELCPLTLLESSMEEIYSFAPEEMEPEEIFEMLYEIEYKYNMMKSKEFSGNPRRHENMMKVLEKVGRKVNSALAETFVNVYENWLESHAILSPRTWARKRAEDAMEFAEASGESPYSAVKSEFNRYDYAWNNYGSVEKGIWANFDKMPALKNALSEHAKEYAEHEQRDMYYNLEQEGYEEFGEMYGQEFSSEEEAEKYIEEYESDPFDILEILDEEAMLALFQNNQEALAELFEHLVFPAWHYKWAQEGIEQTRENIENIYKQLQGMNSLPFEKQNVLINRATNATHQTGSMMDYYEERYGVDEGQLEDLSNRDTEDWDEELREVGVRI
jgi:hypothetical protein